MPHFDLFKLIPFSRMNDCVQEAGQSKLKEHQDEKKRISGD